jgi:hypothetical protein
MGSSPSIDVFISRKSDDAHLAKKLYQYLSDQGLSVFEANEGIAMRADSVFRKTIDDAVEECTHMIVLASSAENIKSKWVEYEWGLYINEKNSGRKDGNIFTVVTPNVDINDLPLSLRDKQMIYFDEKNFPNILLFARKESANIPSPKPFRTKQKISKWTLPFFSVVIGSLLVYFISSITNQQNKPFDTTIFLKPSRGLTLHPSYPPFEGGELSILLDNNEEKKIVLPDGEAVFRQLPSSFLGKKILAGLKSKNWKLKSDTIEISKTIHVDIVPDETLGLIYGSVKDRAGHGIPLCQVIVDANDTTLLTDHKGFFTARLVLRMQKPLYTLDVRKEGYKPIKEYYTAKSGNIDIKLENRNP